MFSLCCGFIETIKYPTDDEEQWWDVFDVVEELPNPRFEIPFDRQAGFDGNPADLTEFNVEMWKRPKPPTPEYWWPKSRVVCEKGTPYFGVIESDALVMAAGEKFEWVPRSGIWLEVPVNGAGQGSEEK